MTVSGIDVSMFQGPFNWPAWRGRIGFGMCKATEGGGWTDPQFAHNWNGMWAMNPAHTFPRFAYCFFHAGQDPVIQAVHLVSVVRGRGLLPGDNFVLDLEPTVRDAMLNDGLTPAQCAPRAVRCLQEVNKLAPGHRVLPYMSPAWARAGGSAGMGPWHLWHAEYGVSGPHVPPPWQTWAFWQRTDQPLDGDVFNGSEADLLEFTRMPAHR